MSMKISVQAENVPGTLVRRYFCEISDGETVSIKREGDNARDAAARCLSALRFMTTEAEKIIEQMLL